jgi:hypothetical protein
MSRRKNYMAYFDGEIVLQCPAKHRLGFIVVPNRDRPRLDGLGRTDQRIEAAESGPGPGPEVPFRRVPPGHPLREACPVCKGNGRKYDYMATWDELAECIAKLRDTQSITLTLL